MEEKLKRLKEEKLRTLRKIGNTLTFMLLVISLYLLIENFSCYIYIFFIVLAIIFFVLFNLEKIKKLFNRNKGRS